MKKLKTTKGITLIALIITVIVLLILAGVSINMVIGENGLINKAKSAVDTYQNSATEEQVFLNEIENYIAGGLANIDSIGGGGTPPKPMPVATVGTITSANSTINGEAYSDKNPIIPANFKAKNDGAAWDAASGPEYIKGLVISDGNSEFVWIPVEDINDMVMCQACGGNIKKLELDETTGEVICANHRTNTNLVGKLYATTTGESFNENLTGQTYTANSSTLREPDNVTSYDSTSNMPSYTPTLYQTEFNKMVKSVAKYKGFYVGRYETSMNGSTAQSKAGVTPMNNINWWRMYENTKTYRASDENIEASMIWGCQYDMMMKFILTNPTDKSRVTATANVAHNLGSNYATGSKSTDKASNIYDLEGNVREWTQEALNNNIRVNRGGDYRGSCSPSFRNSNDTATSTYVGVGSRLTFYIV